jgi:hypothetical protein
VPVLMLIGTMHPSCSVRVNWDTLMLLVLASVCAITPYLICFDVYTSKSTAIGTCFFLRSPPGGESQHLQTLVCSCRLVLQRLGGRSSQC